MDRTECWQAKLRAGMVKRLGDATQRADLLDAAIHLELLRPDKHTLRAIPGQLHDGEVIELLTWGGVRKELGAVLLTSERLLTVEHQPGVLRDGVNVHEIQRRDVTAVDWVEKMSKGVLTVHTPARAMAVEIVEKDLGFDIAARLRVDARRPSA